MAEKTVRVAVIGRTGKGNYGHGLGTIWLQVPNVEIVAVADENEKGLAGAVAKLKAKAGYVDYKEMLAKEKPSMVSFADRWPDCHRDMVLTCAAHGANIFLKNPVARPLTETDGRASLEMILAVYEPHRLAKPVELPLKNRKHPLQTI